MTSDVVPPNITLCFIDKTHVISFQSDPLVPSPAGAVCVCVVTGGVGTLLTVTHIERLFTETHRGQQTTKTHTDVLRHRRVQRC